MVIVEIKDWKHACRQVVRKEVLIRAENGLIALQNLKAFQVKWLMSDDLIHEQQLDAWQAFYEALILLEEEI